MMLAGLTPYSVLLDAPSAREICCSAITGSTFLRYTLDRHDQVFVCIFMETKFQKAYAKIEKPSPIGSYLHPTTASLMWPKSPFLNLSQQKSANQYHVPFAVRRSWNPAFSNCIKSQLAFHVTRSDRTSIKTIRQGSTICVSDIWVFNSQLWYQEYW